MRSQPDCSRIHPAARSPIMAQVRCVFAREIVGMIDASATHSPDIPWTLGGTKTKLDSSLGNAIRSVIKDFSCDRMHDLLPEPRISA
jgi:hypothetical protein